MTILAGYYTWSIFQQLFTRRLKSELHCKLQVNLQRVVAPLRGRLLDILYLYSKNFRLNLVSYFIASKSSHLVSHPGMNILYNKINFISLSSVISLLYGFPPTSSLL